MHSKPNFLLAYNKAKTTFESIHLGTSAYKGEGTWYLAMTLLKQSKVTEANSYLQTIPQGADRYDQAQELLELLKKN